MYLLIVQSSCYSSHSRYVSISTILNSDYLLRINSGIILFLKTSLTLENCLYLRMLCICIGAHMGLWTISHISVLFSCTSPMTSLLFVGREEMLLVCVSLISSPESGIQRELFILVQQIILCSFISYCHYSSFILADVQYSIVGMFHTVTPSH